MNKKYRVDFVASRAT